MWEFWSPLLFVEDQKLKRSQKHASEPTKCMQSYFRTMLTELCRSSNELPVKWTNWGRLSAAMQPLTAFEHVRFKHMNVHLSGNSSSLTISSFMKLVNFNCMGSFFFRPLSTLLHRFLNGSPFRFSRSRNWLQENKHLVFLFVHGEHQGKNMGLACLYIMQAVIVSLEMIDPSSCLSLKTWLQERALGRREVKILFFYPEWRDVKVSQSFNILSHWPLQEAIILRGGHGICFYEIEPY